MQERVAYFSGVPRSDWPKAVDARPTTQPEEGAVSASSNFELKGVGQTESLPWVSEKVWGKRAATDELARNKRKTAGVAPRKQGNISLGGNQTT